MSYIRSKYFSKFKKRKIKYFFSKKDSQIAVIFFHGFMSNMNGKKPIAIQKFCLKHKLNFLRFEYSGHGKSTGNFIEGNISKWTKEAMHLIKSKIKNDSKLIFIGSSMGSWIALNLFIHFKKRIKGFIGIASAPEFLEKLMWKKFDKETKKIIMIKRIYHLKQGEYIYPITKQIILDGRKNKVLNNKINLKIPITLLHGSKDEVVPLNFSRKILKICKKSRKKLIKIKNGDHSLSRKSDLKKICIELNYMLRNI